MRKYLNIFTIILITLFIISACRNESVVESAIPELKGLKANSGIANLMTNTSLNDGSNDNIIDNANCFNIELPVVVVIDGVEIIINTEDDFDIIEFIFNEFDDDDDVLDIVFPITIILNDFTAVVINDMDELSELRDECNDENEFDDDIECIDFNYPISAAIFDIVTEQFTNITINNDEEMHQFLEDLDNDDVVSINFPISLTLSNGTNVTINDLDQLENVIDNAKDDCDEDDDNDFNDDDCEGCSQEQLKAFITSCDNWIVDKLGLNNTQLEEIYEGFTFNFLEDGTINVNDGNINHTGTWSSSGTDSNITVIINISTLPDFNATWNLHEFEEEDNGKKFDLRLPNDNRLRFESNDCN